MKLRDVSFFFFSYTFRSFTKPELIPAITQEVFCLKAEVNFQRNAVNLKLKQKQTRHNEAKWRNQRSKIDIITKYLMEFGDDI